ncbi:MAG: hypothetical protein AABX94_01845, partial [Nanoarchaeota archaeon]
MNINILTLEEIEAITRVSLKNNFPLFREEHHVDASFLDPQMTYFYIGYNENPNCIKRERLESRTQFSLNVFLPTTCCLLYIELERSQRGKGLGWSLYETVHD